MNQKEFHRVFRYEDGILYCKKRDDVKREWNTRYAFKKAGNFRKDMYAMVCVHDKKYLAHRVIYIMHHGDMDSDVKIDHINCNHSDNKIENLRIATMGENSCNVPLSSRNTSGFKGVTWNKRAQRWRDSAQLGNV
ncbi:MAG: HNH endonuclease, partial [Rhodospirillaceae bacterium]